MENKINPSQIEGLELFDEEAQELYYQFQKLVKEILERLEGRNEGAE